ncbi:hypothetical protein C8A03DRAFT_16912 [Achaetomium macrosporum]|uniref:Uncharacterized protein n=1 Tax=Achaetomium macrosporum TaxID=79813 RepID=A0AAN7C812_9PEZI|nr:hypothetical protein C8A03DRAFT_16912 [Achaetomium macrosporum]
MSTSAIGPHVQGSEKRRVTFARNPDQRAANAEDSEYTEYPGSGPNAATRSLRCKRLEISRRDDEVVQFKLQDVAYIRELCPDEVLSNPDIDMIYLLEITDESEELAREQLGHSGLEIPKDFFDAHLGREGRSFGMMAVEQCRNRGTFSANWSVPVKQTQEYWRVAQRLRAGDHSDLSKASYARWPKWLPHRLYHPLLPPDGNLTILHHAMTGVSFHHTKNVSSGCLLLVDSRRQYSFTKVSYDRSSGRLNESSTNSFRFTEEEDTLERMCKRIKSCREKFSCQSTARTITQSIVGLALGDTARALLGLGASKRLDDIKLSLVQDEHLPAVVWDWREYLGHWRNSLVHLRSSTSYTGLSPCCILF